MSLKEDVLFELMAAEKYISGQELAEKYGKSRAAVWKAVKALSKEGYIISAVTNKGYILKKGDDILSKAEISLYLERDIDVMCFASIDSTNSYAKRLLAEGKQGEFLICANEQTAGRGRQGKSFYSPAHTGVYFSLVTRPQTSLQNAVTATTAAATAVCKAIEKLTDKKPKIKWVNDVYLDGEKICGILTEAVTDFETGTVDSVIIGIGINIKTSDFPNDIEGAGCLDAEINRSRLVAEIVNELLEISAGDHRRFIDYYRSHSLVIGQKIKFIENGKITPATAVEIDDRGGLTVRLENGVLKTLRSGEISIRRQ